MRRRRWYRFGTYKKSPETLEALIIANKAGKNCLEQTYIDNELEKLIKSGELSNEELEQAKKELEGTKKLKEENHLKLKEANKKLGL